MHCYMGIAILNLLVNNKIKLRRAVGVVNHTKRPATGSAAPVAQSERVTEKGKATAEMGGLREEGHEKIGGG